MTPSMTGCKAKLQRSVDLKIALDNDIKDFMQAHPVKVTVDRKEVERLFVFRVWNVAKPRIEWSLLFGDALHNARTALDHLAYQLALLHLGRDLTDQEARSINFPVTKTAQSFASTSGSIKKLMRPVDFARLELIQPFGEWDEAIWGDLIPPGPPAPIPAYLNLLSELDNIDKHRMLHPTWASPARGRLPQGARELGITASSTSDQPIEDGVEIGRWLFENTPPELDNIPDPSIYFPIHVSLRSPHFGTRVGRLLNNCITAVQFVLEMFEPCITSGGIPATLKYWDTDKIEL